MTTALTELIERIRSAHASATPLCIRGGGSKDFYGQRQIGEPLDTRAHTGITQYEPSELVVTVRAGTPLAELEAALAEQGQCLPFEPPFAARQATCGGMVAAGLSGPARASAGCVRDHVLGVRLVNGRGEWLSFGGQVIKNVAGYDVSRLMAGAMGCLGLLTDISLKVLPCAPAEATLCFEMTQAQALRQLNAWGAQALPLNASCWLEDAGRARLYLRLRGAQAAVEAACQSLGGHRVEAGQTGWDWAACREQTLPFFTQPPHPGDALWRLSLPQTAPALDQAGTPLIEWHGALRWLWAPATLAPQLRALAAAYGGHATLYRLSSPDDAAHGVFQPLAAPLLRIHRELKRQFDPAGVFNRARLYPEL